MNASFSLSSLFRTLMLGLLMVGILAKPVLAIACEIHDVQNATASAGQAAAADETRLDETGSDESCCSLPDCNDCCAHTTAVIPELLIAPALAMSASPLPSLSVTFEPAAIPVAFRPPIRT